MISLSSALYSIKGLAKISITSETRSDLGNGGFAFQFLRFGRVDDYICELKINGVYCTGLLKKKVTCTIDLKIDPFKQRNSDVIDDNCMQERLYCNYEESRWDKFYHKDAEKLCNDLLYLMEDNLRSQTDAYIKDGNAEIFMSRKKYYGELRLEPGWGTLLKPEEYGYL